MNISHVEIKKKLTDVFSLKKEIADLILNNQSNHIDKFEIKIDVDQFTISSDRFHLFHNTRNYSIFDNTSSEPDYKNMSVDFSEGISKFYNFYNNITRFSDLLDLDRYELTTSEKERYKKAFKELFKIVKNPITELETSSSFVSINLSSNYVMFTVKDFYTENSVSLHFSLKNKKTILSAAFFNELEIVIDSNKYHLRKVNSKGYNCGIRFKASESLTRTLLFSTKDDDKIALIDQFPALIKEYLSITIKQENTLKQNKVSIKNEFEESEFFNLINLKTEKEFLDFFNNDYQFNSKQKEAIELSYLLEDKAYKLVDQNYLICNYKEYLKNSPFNLKNLDILKTYWQKQLKNKNKYTV